MTELTKSKNPLALAVLIFIMILTVMLPETAMAAGHIDTERPVSLTLSCQGQNGPLAGQRFDIYLVAATDKYGELTVTDEFKNFNVNIPGKNDEAWKNLASTLEGYALLEKEKGNLKPTGSGSTDGSGSLTFPSSGQTTLIQGLYLVVGYYHTQSGYYYEPAPFMVTLPGLDSEKNIWEYNVTAKPKQESGIVASPPSYISRKVLKVWNDKGNEKYRPDEVTVRLLRNGMVYDTVKLSAAGGWSHYWSNLSSAYKWNVVEETGESYNVEITQEGITFVVRNTYDENVPDNPDNPDNPSGTGEEGGGGHGGTSGGGPGSGASGNKLPQTGMLWWPVPVLSAAGLALLGIGLLRRKEGR